MGEEINICDTNEVFFEDDFRWESSYFSMLFLKLF